MAFIVEDGSGLSNATAYASVVEGDSYWADRNDLTLWIGLSEAAKQAALIEASQFIDGRFDWKGEKASADQALAWPRSGATDGEDHDIASTVIPAKVKDAVCHLAREAVSGALWPASERGGAVLRSKVKVDVIEEETEYAEGAPPGRSFAAVAAILKGLYRGGTALRRT